MIIHVREADAKRFRTQSSLEGPEWTEREADPGLGQVAAKSEKSVPQHVRTGRLPI